MYVYFISYTHPLGAGRCEVKRDKAITSVDEIKEIESALLAASELKGVSIVNFILLRTEDVS